MTLDLFRKSNSFIKRTPGETAATNHDSMYDKLFDNDFKSVFSMIIKWFNCEVTWTATNQRLQDCAVSVLLTFKGVMVKLKVKF